MSISSSLNAGVAGLSANATRLATISDNIANSGTYGYKRASADFENFVIDNGRNAGTYSAGGVRAVTSRLIDEQGAPVSTSNPLDLAVSGRGMLPVTPAVSLGASSGSRPLMMTTTGAFRTDEQGVLTTQSGLVLLGWPANANGTIPVLPRDTTAGLVPVTINANQTAGDPTTAVNLGVNLPATDTQSGSPGTTLPLSVEYFGNLGTSESLGIDFTPTVPASGASNTWTMVVRDSAQAGAVVYGRCSACHGPGAVAAGMAPDLRAAATVTAADSFASIVRTGARANRGMPRYTELSDQELTALRHYIRQQADLALRRKP